MQLRENRNLSLSIRVKAALIYVLSVTVHNDSIRLVVSHDSTRQVWKHDLAILSITYEFYDLGCWWSVTHLFLHNACGAQASTRCVSCYYEQSDSHSVWYYFAARGVRKVTTGITGLWPRSVQSDAAFWFFDVGSSYHCVAEVTKCRIVHPLTGNVSWV